MCYPGGASLVGRRNLVVVQGRWFVLQTSAAAEQLPTEVAGEADAAAGGPTKQCVCSPTRHPGSFRCRHHHADQYVWGGRITRN
ncbi:hypothetical protein Dsin_015450 [Dipteronia sinensis]|uniref:Uncharacterized protein n=1 Tax=Dipteronia sinensis TaxID=43782 RepID=A0AAE0ABB8_9ROSI|nr:hypothetical protein Dsin_015450 [Dipteronia sinensis]